MSAANRLWRGFGKAQVAHFSCAHQFSHGPDGFFDWSLRVHAVLVIQIDGLDAKALQTGLTAGTYIFGLPVGAADRGFVSVAKDAKFRGEENLVSAVTDSVAN